MVLIRLTIILMCFCALCPIGAAAESLSPGALLERLRLRGNPTPAEVAAVLDSAVQQSAAQPAAANPAEQCRRVFIQGEWHRVAASLVPDAGYQDVALGHYRAMRLDYGEQAISWLGYIGEARLHRQEGRAEEAAAVLQAVLNDESGVDSRVRRLAELEALEVALLRDPAAALEGAQAVGSSGRWLTARAHAALGDASAAVDSARRATGVSPYDRLELIGRLGERTADERRAWVELLVGLGREEEALAVLDQAASDADQPGNNQPAHSDTAWALNRLHARLLYNAGRQREAAAVWDVVANDRPDDVESVWLAASVWSHVAEATNDESVGPAARVALRRAVDAELTTSQRVYALQRWCRLADNDQHAQVLSAYPDLVNGDAWLRYTWVMARLRSAGTPALQAELARELQDVQAMADDDALVATIVLARVELLRDTPRPALELLQEHEELLRNQPHTAEASRQLQVAMWIDTGLIDQAMDAVLADGQSTDAGALRSLSEGLAERYEQHPEATIRAQVARLLGEAVARAPGDTALVEQAGGLLVRVEAWSDAVRVLAGVQTPTARLTSARALLALGRDDEAWPMLDGLESPAAMVLRASWLVRQGQAAEALTPARAARAASEPGRRGGDTAVWWDATCVLVEAQIALDERLAAAKVLRVSEVLHPIGARPALRRRVASLREELSE